MTRIHVLSDIHDDYSRTHFGNWTVPADVDCDVLIVAGDLAGRFSRMGRDWIEAQRKDVPIIVVPGNHCFWKASLENEVAKFRDRLQYGHIHVLDGDAIVLDGTRFVGGTLWTDYALWRGDVTVGMNAARTGLNDFKYMRKNDHADRVAPEDLLAIHKRHRAAIEATLAVPFDGPTVVVTHHAPSPQGLRYGSVTEPLDAAYASDMDDMIRRTCPDLWIHGHVHRRQEYKIGGTLVVANPRGYVGWRRMWGQGTAEIENESFDERLVVEVGRGFKPRIVAESSDHEVDEIVEPEEDDEDAYEPAGYGL